MKHYGEQEQTPKELIQQSLAPMFYIVSSSKGLTASQQSMLSDLYVTVQETIEKYVPDPVKLPAKVGEQWSKLIEKNKDKSLDNAVIDLINTYGDWRQKSGSYQNLSKFCSEYGNSTQLLLNAEQYGWSTEPQTEKYLVSTTMPGRTTEPRHLWAYIQRGNVLWTNLSDYATPLTKEQIKDLDLSQCEKQPYL